VHPWTADQLRVFLGWSREHNTANFIMWHVLAYTGMRRGELLALRWRDIDLDAATVSIRKSVTVVKNKGKPDVIREGDTKTNKPRVIDLDPATVEVIREWKRERGLIALQLARDSALAFGNHGGKFRHPDTFSQIFKENVARCGKMLGDNAPPEIRLHDLRHTHATILLRDRENVRIVSERLGHASVTVTLSVYHHVMPGDQRQAAARFAALVSGVAA
jgi:integrase